MRKRDNGRMEGRENGKNLDRKMGLLKKMGRWEDEMMGKRENEKMGR